MQTLRFADAQTVTQYPLEIPTLADWHQTGTGWRSVVPLPDLPGATIVAPSLSILDDPDYRFQFTLSLGSHEYPLPAVPPDPSSTAHVDPSNRRVRTAIDCFHTQKAATRCQLIVDCFSELKPSRYLLTISMRPTELEIESPTNLESVSAPRPPTHSQMLENPRIAGRICSPVSTAMVLRLHRPCVGIGSVVNGCLDPVTRMYGMWPLAVRTASRYGVIGAVELFSDWTPVVACLDAGLPVVASIRYGRGELPGAAQPATGGHLVVVHGIDDDEVLINDPAAPNHGSVDRRCPLAAFARAWFRYRGAAYILIP